MDGITVVDHPLVQHKLTLIRDKHRSTKSFRELLKETGMLLCYEVTRDLPLTESLKDTVARFMPYWREKIAPALSEGARPLIAAHGNSLRALVKYLDNISDQEIVGLNIPTGIPLVYELDDDLKPIRHFYLGDPDAVKKATEAVAGQLQKKS